MKVFLLGGILYDFSGMGKKRSRPVHYDPVGFFFIRSAEGIRRTDNVGLSHQPFDISR